MTEAVVLDGRLLTPAALRAVARDGAPVRLDPEAVRRNAQAFALGERLARGPDPLYGASTGVGALHDERVGADDGAGHALRLLHSHAAGAGPRAPRDLARALLVVRANQIGAGGAGVSPALLEALVAVVADGLAPAVHEWGGIGTADLTALAEAGLALLGEGSWLDRGDGKREQPAVRDGGALRDALTARDGLALLSSNALTVAEAALRACEVADLLPSAEAVTALGVLACAGQVQPFDPRVAAARGHPGQVIAAGHLWGLLRGARPEPARLQDPLSFRCAAQVFGAAREALEDLEQVLGRELNAGTENPLLLPVDGEALHHGDFDTTRLGLSLANLRAALVRVGAQSVARTSALLDERRTGLSTFLTTGPAGSSGALILEYTGSAALAELRAAAVPEQPGAVLAFGQEDQAPFTTAGAYRLRAAISALRTIVAAECVTAVRALRLADRVPGPAGARRAYERAAAVLPAELGDRPLAGDLAAAEELLSGPPIG